MFCCAPETVLDGGPAMIGKVLGEWAWRDGVRLNFIEPGKPVQGP
jgi:putative transposase